MKCNEVKPLLYLLADNELEKTHKKTVLEHIMECHNCREEYQRVMDMKTLISSRIQVDDLDQMDIINKNIGRKRFMRKPLAIALAASLMVMGLVIPVYGQDMISTVQAWVKQVTFSVGGTDYQIRTDLIGEDLDEEPSSANIFSSLDWALERFDFPVTPPSYLPMGYSFYNVETYVFNGGATNLLVIKYSNDEVNNGEPSLDITYEFIEQEIVERDILYSEGTRVKETSVIGNPAIFHKSVFEAGSSSIGLDIMLDKGEAKMLRIFMLVDTKELNNNLPAFENEMLSMAKSILQ